MSACGTYSGYQAHIRRQESTCDDCREANAAYMKDYRSRHPDEYRRAKNRDNARQRATRRLAEKYRAEFNALYLEELGDTRFQPDMTTGQVAP